MSAEFMIATDMARFLVTYCVDGDTFDVDPGWVCWGHEGNRIRPSGYNAPELKASDSIANPKAEAAKLKLESLILGKIVELEPITMSYQRLLCHVYIDGVPLESHFPEYSSAKRRKRSTIR